MDKHRLSYRACIVAAHLLAAAGLAGLGVLLQLMPGPFWGLLLSAALYAAGGGLIEARVSPIAEACPTKNKAAVMSLLHSFYCWGQGLTVALLSVLLFPRRRPPSFGQQASPAVKKPPLWGGFLYRNKRALSPQNQSRSWSISISVRT